MTRLRLRIDRIVADSPGIDRQALERALRAELVRMVAASGSGTFDTGGTLPLVRATLAPAGGPLPARIAAAAIRAVAARSVTP